MSTFIQLVQDLARQSGTLAGGTSLSSVVGVSGRAAKLVKWVEEAWTDIQNTHFDWNWMLEEFSSALLVDTLRYTGAGSFSLTRFSSFVVDRPDWQPITIYDPDIGQSDESPLKRISYPAWRSKYDRGVHDAGRPVEYSISPAGELCIGPKPDKAYVCRGEYWKTPQTLTLNTDVPECPERFHKVIVHRAMILMGESDESPTTIQAGAAEYNRLMSSLVNSQLPSLSLCGPLA